MYPQAPPALACLNSPGPGGLSFVSMSSQTTLWPGDSSTHVHTEVMAILLIKYT